jgi:nicotinamide-nucleotide amidase
MFAPGLREEAEEVLAACRAGRLHLATAESCTGGLLSALLTAVPGSSAVVECGFVTYSDASKTALLGVPPALLEAHGAVSAEVAQAMVEGALVRGRAQLAVAVTGIAGPGGGSAHKPVGLVYLACARQGQPPRVERQHFGGDREAVREASVRRALALLREAAGAP